MSKQLTTITPHILVPSFCKLNLQEARFICLALSLTYIKNQINPDEFYEVPVELYAKCFNITKSTAYKDISDIIKSIMDKKVRVKTDILQNVAHTSEFSDIYWFDRIDYAPNIGQIHIRWHRDMAYIFNNLGKDIIYSKFALPYIAKISSINTLKFFFFLNKWTKTPKATFKVDELKELLDINNEYAEWDNFHRKILKKSLEEINKVTNLSCSYALEKENRKVVKITFSVGQKEPQICVKLA